MEEVLKLAEQLGRAVAETERYKAMRTAEKAVAADPEAKALDEEYTRVAMKIQELEVAGKPIEPEDKRALQSAKEKLAADPKIQELTRAWADYNEMIARINSLVFEKLGKD